MVAVARSGTNAPGLAVRIKVFTLRGMCLLDMMQMNLRLGRSQEPMGHGVHPVASPCTPGFREQGGA